MTSPTAGTPAPATPAATPLDIVPTAPGGHAEPRGGALPPPRRDLPSSQTMSSPWRTSPRRIIERLVAAPTLARQKVGDALAATVGQSAPQVHAAHILLPTREAAEAARARVTEGGEDFAAVARELSTDESTAANGGELGWFTREEMVGAVRRSRLRPGTGRHLGTGRNGVRMARDPGHGAGSGSAVDRCSDQPPAAGGRRALARGGARRS